MPNKIKLRVNSTDSRFETINPIIDTSGASYKVLVDRFSLNAVIKNSSDIVVAQVNGNGNITSTLQAVKNYMINSLSCIFNMDNNIRFDNTGLALSTPSNKTLTYSVVPTSGAITLTYNSVAATSSIPYNATATQVQDALRTIAALPDVTVTGTVASTFIVKMGGVVTPLTIATTANTLQRDAIIHLAFGAVPTSGAFTISYGGNPTASIPYTATAAQVQTALRLVTGLSAVTVAGNFTSGFDITMVGIASPTAVTAPTNTLSNGSAVSITVTTGTAYAASSITVS